MQDQCDQQATAAGSGRPAGPLTKGASRVAAGSIGGRAWSLWAAGGTAGVGSVENGGLVIGGRWYGLCPGAPNPAEFELLDVGARGIVYGYVANPGRYAITMRPAGALSAPQVRRVRGGTFFLGQLARSACAYPALTLYATVPGVTGMHQFSFGTCTPGQLVATTGGHGSW